jgi:hypothetical protein
MNRTGVKALHGTHFHLENRATIGQMQNMCTETQLSVSQKVATFLHSTQMNCHKSIQSNIQTAVAVSMR